MSISFIKTVFHRHSQKQSLKGILDSVKWMKILVAENFVFFCITFQAKFLHTSFFLLISLFPIYLVIFKLYHPTFLLIYYHLNLTYSFISREIFWKRRLKTVLLSVRFSLLWILTVKSPLFHCFLRRLFLAWFLLWPFLCERLSAFPINNILNYFHSAFWLLWSYNMFTSQ